MSTHLAALSPAPGDPLTLHTRPTPTPGPHELLIAVKSVALNPADLAMRDTGLFILAHPAVLGFDLSGLVLAVGADVPTGASPTAENPTGPVFIPGTTRVAAYASTVWHACNPDFGAFQQRVLVPWQHAAPLPDAISWNEAATLPVAAEVPLNAWDLMEIPRLGEATRENMTRKTHALLIWGASSSVGSMGVQSARLLRDDRGSDFAAVYATAGAANHAYVRGLGADRVFDYADPQVAAAIVEAARADALVIQHCFLATGELAACQAVLGAFVVDGRGGKIASAPVVPPHAEVEGVEVVFALPSTDEAERLAQFEYWMGTWLREGLASGKVRPSPEVRVVGRGLGALEAGLDVLRRGVSCAKLVVEVEE